MTVLSTGRLAELLYPGIAKIWGIKYNEYPALYKEFFDMRKSDKAFEKEQEITSFPTAGIKEEGDEIEFSELYQGYQKEYRHLTYSIGATITREMVEDDQYNVINQIPAMLAQSMRHTEEIVATNVINNGFTAGNYALADGQAYFSTAHPLVGGGTGTNTPANPTDLTQDALEQAIIDIMDFRDEQGKRLRINAKTLLLPRSLYFTGSKILETKYAVGSNDNDVNILANMAIKLIATNFLTDQDQWTVITDCPNGPTFYTRREAEIDKFSDDRSQDLNIVSTKRFSVGVTDWRSAWSSPGA